MIEVRRIDDRTNNTRDATSIALAAEPIEPGAGRKPAIPAMLPVSVRVVPTAADSAAS